MSNKTNKYPKPKKSFGQNFLLATEVIDKIVQAARIEEGDIVLEVGGGTGNLTKALVETNAQKIFVVEKDESLIPNLEKINSKKIEIIEGDALDVNLAQFGQKIKVVANLPYNVATKIFFKFLNNIDLIKSLTLMFQKEVAKRICAKEGNKSYGKISVITDILCEAELLMDVPPELFFPPPKVMSSVVNVIPKKQQVQNKEISQIKEITSLLFLNRRKMIKKSLEKLTSDIDELCDYVRIKATDRVEDLSPQKFLLIVKFLNL